jgi:competence protein ComEC
VLNRKIPFLRIVSSVCIGIISGLYFKPDQFFLFTLLIVIISGFTASLFFNKRLTNLFYGFPLTMALILCGHLLYVDEKKSLSNLEPGIKTYVGSLSEYPEEKENSCRIIVKLLAMVTDTGNVPVSGSLLIYTKKDAFLNSLLPGDFMKIRCSVKPIVNRGNPYEFNYRFYMENHGVKYFSFVNTEGIIKVFHPDHRKLKHRALIIREKIIDMYEERGIRGDRLALVAAITLGQKSMLDQEQKLIFIKAGVMHIMAVSGLHAVILSVFVFNMLFFMKKKLNSFRILITVLLLWSFAFVTGLTPSVIRAALMFTFLQAGQLMKRNVNSMNSVLASAFIILILHPSGLFDAGFLLSYSSVIFIICFYRDLYIKLRLKTWIADKIWQSAAVTILAQAGTLPMTISLFNRFPTWFILTNIVIVPLSSFLIIVGCLVPLTYPLKFISQPLASLLSYLTGLTEMLTEKASALPLSTIGNIGMVTNESILFFFVIFLFTMHFLNRKKVPVLYPVYLLCIYLFVGTLRIISDKASTELIIYDTSVSDAIGIRKGKTLIFLGGLGASSPEVLRHCATKGLKIEQSSFIDNALLVRIGENKILVSSYLNNKLIQSTKPDHLILTGSHPQIEKNIRIKSPLNSFIITQISDSPNLNLTAILNNNMIDTIHYIKKSGAFRIRL